MLYRSTDRLCRCGAPMQNLAHSASFESLDKDAPSKPGIKHLGSHHSVISLPHTPPRLVERGDEGLEVREAGRGGDAALDARGCRFRIEGACDRKAHELGR